MNIVTYVPSLEARTAEALASALREQGINPIPAGPAGKAAPQSATTVLATALVDWEELLARQAPQGLLLAGDDDHVLAGALSAAKLELPMIRIAAEPGGGAADDARPPASNARLIALLVPDRADAGDPARAASEIAGWLQSLPTLPVR